MPIFSKQRKEVIPPAAPVSASAAPVARPTGLPISPASSRRPPASTAFYESDATFTSSQPTLVQGGYDPYAQPRAVGSRNYGDTGSNGARQQSARNQDYAQQDPYARRAPSSSEYQANEGYSSRAGTGGPSAGSWGPGVPREQGGGGAAALGGARARLQGLQDPYGRKQLSTSDARAELLRGAPPPKERTQQQQDENGGGPKYGDEEDDEEEVEGIKQNLRFVKQESLASTRNALRIAREAAETGQATLERLGDQSDRLANAERSVDLANAYSSRAQDDTNEIKALNRSIFRPNFNINKSSQRAKEEARIQSRYDSERAEREETRHDQYTSRQRINAAKKNMAGGDAFGPEGKTRVRGEERKRYQFETTASDDEVEDEIEDNLDALGDTVGRLKMLAMATGEEVDKSFGQIDRLTQKVDRTDSSLIYATGKLARVGK